MPELIESIKNLILSKDFCDRHKTTPTAFTRKRLLTFERLIFLLLNMNNNSYQVELDRFYKIIFDHDIPQRVLYKSNLTKAREKLDHEAFIELNDNMVCQFYDQFDHQKWYGMNLLAIDGSIVRLPNNNKIVEHFGGWSTNYGASVCPVARVSQMFDVLNKITVDAIINPKSDGEREMASYHLLKLQPKDLILLDRGYHAHWFYKIILAMGAQFCARVPYDKGVIKRFYKSGKAQDIVYFQPSQASKDKCWEMGYDDQPIPVRLIRVELNSGDVEILATSLVDQCKFPKALFKDLYHKRWSVEEDYKSIKFKLQLENFSGNTVHSIYQDFHAKVFSKNITAIIASTTQEKIKEKSKKCKYVHQINFAQALARMKDTIVLLFKSGRKKIFEYIRQLQDIFIQTTEAIKPDRSFPRRNQIRRPRFFVGYKTTC
jgi:hypothetical protein